MRQFFQTTLVGGLLFLVPVIALIFILERGFDLARKIVSPLSDKLGFESLIGLPAPFPLAVLALIGFCFVAGLIAKRSRVNSLVKALENAILSKVPGYRMMKSTSESILGDENAEQGQAVMVRFDDGWQFGLRIETLENGLVAVFIPDAPNPNAGSVFFMTPDRLTTAEISIPSMLSCLRGIGGGADKLVGKVHFGGGA